MPNTDESDETMRKYLLKLEKKIDDKEWGSMVMIMDDMSVLYQSGTKRFDRPGFLKSFKDRPEKFGNKQIAFISVCCIPEGAKIGAPWVLSISLDMMKLDAKGAISRSGDLGSWSLELLLYKEDLAKKPFKFDLVKQLLKMGYNKVVHTQAGAAHGYKGLQEKIERTKSKIIRINKKKAKEKKLEAKKKQRKSSSAKPVPTKRTAKKTSKKAVATKRGVTKKSSTKRTKTPKRITKKAPKKLSKKAKILPCHLLK